jgi:hypothetical protein
MRASKILLGLMTLVLGAGLVSGVAVAKKPVLILRENKGGPIVALHAGIDGFLLEEEKPFCSTGWGFSQAELTSNLKTKDKIKVNFTDSCEEAFGLPIFLVGRITGVQLNVFGEVFVTGKISKPVACTGKCEEREGAPGGICHYEAKKFIGVLPLPSSMDFEAEGLGKLNAKTSAASCGPTDAIIIGINLFGPKKNGTENEPFYSLYAEDGA